MDRRSKEPVFGLAKLTSRFVRNTRGAVAIWFAVLALPMAVLAFGLIDVNRAGVEKRHLQDALDAATLLAARSTATTDSALQTIGEAALKAQLTGSSDATLKTSSFKLSGTKIVSSATADVTPIIANLWLGHDMTVGANAEVMRSSTNLELALVLDLTQSMSGTKITDLKQAAKDLLDLVISDVQTPYYSKAAIVPYSYGVNLGTYAAAGRGAPVTPISITGSAWQSGTTSKAITAVTRANPAVVTSANHGYSNGDTIYITGVKGMTELNGKAFVVANKGTNSFQLQGVNSTNYNKWTSNGTIVKCLVAACDTVVTANSNGFYANGDYILIKSVTGGLTNSGGTSLVNNKNFNIANVSGSTFSLPGVFGPTTNAWTSGGNVTCYKYGCESFRFTNNDGGTNTYQINTCATERMKADGTNDYTDTAPGTLPAGKQYTSGGGACLSSTITPLSSARETLKTTIGAYTVSGSTAGQIGVGWGWYAVSPEFAPMWPAGSKPAAYGTKDLLKVVVLMTDGAFNTPYCKGVQASNAEVGNDDTHINCAGTDGIVQAKAMCEAMKKKGVIVYTVGFALGNDADAIDLMNKCATDANHVYLPSGGAALKDAFAAIGRDITKLRLSK